LSRVGLARLSRSETVVPVGHVRACFRWLLYNTVRGFAFLRHAGAARPYPQLLSEPSAQYGHGPTHTQRLRSRSTRAVAVLVVAACRPWGSVQAYAAAWFRPELGTASVAPRLAVIQLLVAAGPLGFGRLWADLLVFNREMPFDKRALSQRPSP
jgi:hypothetical protein